MKIKSRLTEKLVEAGVGNAELLSLLNEIIKLANFPDSGDAKSQDLGERLMEIEELARKALSAVKA